MMSNMIEGNQNKMVVFGGKQIRRVFHEGEWFFSVVDVVATLTDSPTPRQYWGKVKDREFAKLQLSPIWIQLKMMSDDGKKYDTDCANTKAMFRIIQSIPSPKAEPFKLWLAKVGYERVQEIENPELASQRARALYKAKGYPDTWIEKRMRSIAIRDELTEEWKERGVKEDLEYSILTAEISKATFGLTPSEYKRLKGLKRENLRDHMNDLELIFSMLGEASTTEIARTRDTKGFKENKEAARDGGKIAGNARKALEDKSGKRVVSTGNFLPGKEAKKRISAPRKSQGRLKP